MYKFVASLSSSTLGSSLGTLQNFLVEAHRRYHVPQPDTIRIAYSRHSSSMPAWSEPTCKLSRPWDSVFLHNKEQVLDDMRRFCSAEEAAWYADMGIPYRRGYLLWGPPGTGKTTLVSALASQLDASIFCLGLADTGATDDSVRRLVQKCPAGSIILLEDLDRALPNSSITAPRPVASAQPASAPGSAVDTSADVHSPALSPHAPAPTTTSASAPEPTSTDVPYPAIDSAPLAAAPPADDKAASPRLKRAKAAVSTTAFVAQTPSRRSEVTMSGLLNALDGVGGQEGCIVIATTRLDPALCRPGRFDVTVRFTHASPQQVRDMFKHFYRAYEPEPETSKEASTPSLDVERQNNGYKPPTLTNGCLALATDGQGGTRCSGGGGGVGGDQDDEDEDEERPDARLATLLPPSNALTQEGESGAMHPATATLDTLADAFVAAIFPRVNTDADTGTVTNTGTGTGNSIGTTGSGASAPRSVSPANLQSYLMQFKGDPRGAVARGGEAFGEGGLEAKKGAQGIAAMMID